MKTKSFKAILQIEVLDSIDSQDEVTNFKEVMVINGLLKSSLRRMRDL